MSTWPCGRMAAQPKLLILSIFEGFDLSAAATIIDIGRHQPKLISATRPRSQAAS